MRIICLAIIIFITFPALSVAQSPDELFSWLPEINNWKKKDTKEIFNPDNLFDRINGAAPLFLENGFQEMTTCDYINGDDYITIQAYRHATPEDAFGMYASERSFDLTFYKIGGEAHGDNSSIYFFAGSVYVKIRGSSSSDETGDAIRKIAEAFASKIAPLGATYPKIISTFPDKNKIPNSEAYITSNYIGHEFLKKVFVSKYKEDNIEYQLFVVDAGNSGAAKEILSKYINFTKQTIELNEGIILIKDRYNGDIPCLWKGQYIIGIFNEDGKAISNAENIISNIAL